MKKIVAILRKDPKRKYTITDFIKLQLLPWAKDGRTVQKILDADREGQNILRAKITGTDKYQRYLVTGENIINYLETNGPALMAMVRKPKTNERKKTSGGKNTKDSDSIKKR